MKDMKYKVGLMLAAMPMMCYAASSSVLAQIYAEFPDTPLQVIQMLTTVAHVVSLITSLVVGKLTWRFNKRNMILVTGLLYPVCGLIIFFFHPNVLFILVFTALMGIASGVRVTGIPALVYDCFEGETSARLLGLQGAFISVGAMVFAWGASQLARNDWTKCYLVYLLAFVIWIVEFICLPKGKLELAQEKGANKEKVPPIVWIITIVTFGATFFVATFSTNISLLMDVRHIGGTVEAGYGNTIYSFCGIFAGIVTGYIVTRVRYKIYAAGMLFGLAGALLCLFGGNVAILCLGGALSGICFSAVVPAGNFFAADEASDYNRSLCVALLNSGSALGQFLSPVILGTAMSAMAVERRVPATYLVAVIGFAVLCLASLVIFGIKKIGRR